MKKIYTVLFTLFFLTTSMFAQQSVNIDNALDTVVSEIKAKVPSGVELAVATIGADTKELSDYIAKELESRLIRTGKFTLVERNAQNLRIINAEIDYQYSGNVDDSSMVELGYRLGAKYLVYGSFEQFGGLMQLTIKATSVETGEIPVIASFSITSSSKITDLLGDQRALNTAQDYLDMIARCQQKLNSIENDKNKEIQNNTANIYAKYQTQINEARARERKPWESTAEHEEIIAKNISDLEIKRDTELSGVSKNVSIKYDNQYKMVELQMNKLTEDLQNTSFVLKGNSVQVLIGEYMYDENPQHWPVAVRSLDKLINYTYNGKRTMSGADRETEYNTIEAARKNGTLEGEITYKVESTDSKMRFNIRVVNVRVNDTHSYTTILNETVNQVVGSVNATTVQQNDNIGILTNNEANIQIKDTSSSKIESTTAGYNVNPFEQAFCWVYSGSKGQVNIKRKYLSYNGQSYVGLNFNGFTGVHKSDWSDWTEAKSNTNYVSDLKETLFGTKGIRFKASGDGKNYSIVFRIIYSNGTYSDFQYDFKTYSNKTVEIEIPYTKLEWQSYSVSAEFDINLVESIIIKYNYSTPPRSNTFFDLTIFDVELY
ncbi:MAG: hypothetical protein IJA53_07990 [Spirochaetaceae bacterium]|nr:hypothetical protein [Spirochaetaceae bacterium]